MSKVVEEGEGWKLITLIAILLIFVLFFETIMVGHYEKKTDYKRCVEFCEISKQYNLVDTTCLGLCNEVLLNKTCSPMPYLQGGEND